jgi:hypothetical protein
MIPLIIKQYIKEETISQFVDGDYYELAFYGSDMYEPFIEAECWWKESVLNDLIYNNKKLAICYMREPAFEHDIHVEKQILLGHDLVLKHNINPKNIVYFYSTNLGKQTHKAIAEKHNLKQQPFTIITFPYYEVDAYKKVIEQKICDHVTPEDTKTKNAVRTFLSLNGKPNKFMRLKQVALYWQRRLMNNGLITLTRTEEDKQHFPNLKDYYPYVSSILSEKDFEKLCKHWPHSLDEHNVEKGLYGKHFSGYPFDKKLFADTYLSVISETHSGAHDCNPQFFPTEKTYKAIINCHPFIMLSTQYYLKELQAQGYKTFAPYIDESYDQEPDAYKRMNLAIDQIEKLSKDGVPVDMLQTAIYNYAHLKSRVLTHLELVKGLMQ